MTKAKKVNKAFLWIVSILVLFGFLVFYSASTGLAAREGLGFYGVVINQLIIGVLLGFFAMFICSKIPSNFWKKWGMMIFFGTLVLTFAVFVPGWGVAKGEATRWIGIGNFTFQPSELLKVGSIIFIASWFNFHKKKLGKGWFATNSLIVTIALVSIPLILQKDFDVIFLIAVTLIGMYLVSKAPLKQALILGLGILIVGGTLSLTVPHIKSRVFGFLNPNEGGQTINYQAQQSQIAIGSGGIFGKGFGQSTQKFGNLPEPTSDSIFAVLAEEFGLIGSTVLVILYFLFAVFGYKIACRSKTTFGSLFTFGIVTLILLQSFMNVASMVGLFPITGQPLVFVSHGGTSLLVTLAMVGVILNVSKA
jgi:cell division protein FtsW